MVGNARHVLTGTGTETNAVLAFTFVSVGLECRLRDVGLIVLKTAPKEDAFFRQVVELPSELQSLSEPPDSEVRRMVPEPLPKRLSAKARSNVEKEIGMVAAELVPTPGNVLGRQ